MTAFVDIIFTLFFLVPGFLIGRIHQAAREFRELSAFEYTTISVAQSFLVFAVWALWVLAVGSVFPFHLIDNLKDVILKGKNEILFSNFLAIFGLTYLTAFGLVSLAAFNVSWARGVNKGFRALGFNRFSEHLTPWEDFLVLSHPHWVVVELKDGRKVQGKIAFGSHAPFSRELVLSRVKRSPIRVYDPQNNLVNYGRDLELSYIGADAIQDMHMVRDEAVERAKRGNPVVAAVSFFLCAVVFAFFMMLFALSLDGSLRALPSWAQFLAPLTIPLLLWNLKSLGKFS